jgi:hypothetical protein
LKQSEHYRVGCRVLEDVNVEARHVEARHVEARHVEARHVEVRHVEVRHVEAHTLVVSEVVLGRHVVLYECFAENSQDDEHKNVVGQLAWREHTLDVLPQVSFAVGDKKEDREDFAGLEHPDDID